MQSIIKLNDVSYYNSKDLKDEKENIAFFYGCSTSVRKIIEKKCIPDNHYTYAIQTKNNPFIPSSKDSKRSTLLLSVEWCQNNVPSCRKRRDTSNDEKEEGLQVAPPVLILNDEEKFKDVDGNILEVEVRGERHPDKIFFYGKDIQRILSLVKIQDILNDRTSNYEEGIHYKKFIHSQAGTTSLSPNKTSFEGLPTGSPGGSTIKNNKTTIFLTYRGLIRMLMTRRDPVSKLFEEWAINILFTHHLGTTEQKQEQASNLIGVSVESIKDFLLSCPVAYSEIYLCALGKVSNLSKTFPGLSRIDTVKDTDLVIKFGYTKNLSNRLYQHQTKYEKIEGVKVSLLMHSPVDAAYLSEAESELRKYFISEDCILDHPEHKEIIVLPEKKLKTMRVMFEQISRKFSGNVGHIQDLLKTKEREHILELEKTKKEFTHELEKQELTLNLLHEKELRHLEVNLEKKKMEDIKELMISLFQSKSN